MLPDARVDLIEAIGRKCEFIERAATAGGIVNAHAVNARSEEWAAGEGREAYDAVTARAVARLSTLAELASPLLGRAACSSPGRGGGIPTRRPNSNAGHPGSRWSWPKSGPPIPTRGAGTGTSTCCEVGPDPDDLPRRAGMAKKRPRADPRGVI